MARKGLQPKSMEKGGAQWLFNEAKFFVLERRGLNLEEKRMKIKSLIGGVESGYCVLTRN